MPKAVKLAPNVAKKMIANLQATISMLQGVPTNQFDRKAWAAVANELNRCTGVAGSMNTATELTNEEFFEEAKTQFDELQDDPYEEHIGTEDPGEVSEFEDTDDDTDDAGDGPPEIGDSGFPMGR